MGHSVQKLSGLHIVESSHNNRELGVEVILFLLYSASVRDDLNTWTPTHDELGHDLSLLLIDILEPEQKLSVEIGKVNCVHVDQVNLPNPTQGQVFDYLASESSSAHNKYLKVVGEVVHDGVVPSLFEGGLVEWGAHLQEGSHVGE